MVFMARPSVALLALQGLHYKCTVEGVWDTLRVSVYDGAVRNTSIVGILLCIIVIVFNTTVVVIVVIVI